MLLRWHIKRTKGHTSIKEVLCRNINMYNDTLHELLATDWHEALTSFQRKCYAKFWHEAGVQGDSDTAKMTMPCDGCKRRGVKCVRMVAIICGADACGSQQAGMERLLADYQDEGKLPIPYFDGGHVITKFIGQAFNYWYCVGTMHTVCTLHCLY